MPLPAVTFGLHFDEVAAGYLALGWSIVPAHTPTPDGCSCRQENCAAIGKHPRVRWADYQRRAPTTLTVSTWWHRAQDANIAIITGAVSGIIVIDVDPRHGGDASLSQLLPLPDTVRAITGGGGQHIYFRHPGYPVPNGANLLPGIDVRGDGGYVIAPPSLHASGQRYAWDPGPDTCPISTAPQRVLDLLLAAKTPQRHHGMPAAFDLESLIQAGTIPNGQRNDTLTRVAGHYAGQGKSVEEVTSLTGAANRTLCTPPLEAAEIKAIVASIMGRERRKAAAQTIALNPTKAENLTDIDRIAAAAVLWAELGVPAITDWVLLRGDTNEYILTTPEDESRLGDDLLDQRRIRKIVQVDLGFLLTPISKNDWPPYTQRLRHLVREENVEPTRASERIEDWLEAFCERNQPQERPVDQRKDALSDGILVDGRLCLKPARLARFIEGTQGEKITPGAVRKLLKRAGWESTVFKAGEATIRAWRAPANGAKPTG